MRANFTKHPVRFRFIAAKTVQHQRRWYACASLRQVKHAYKLLAFTFEDYGGFHIPIVASSRHCQRGCRRLHSALYAHSELIIICTRHFASTNRPMEAYVEHAIDIGLREIGFADHNPLPHGYGANVRMAESELDYYVQRVLDLRFQYRGKIVILLGLEMDFIEGQEDYLAKQIARYPWDYILGAVHYFDPECGLQKLELGTAHDPVDEQYARYFAGVRKLARDGLCDIIAHLDVVKRCGRQPSERGLAEIPTTLAEIARAGLCMEINTSGYRHTELSQQQPYPTLPVVAQAIKLGIPLVVNSDAHKPEQVGFKFPHVEEFIRRQGCQQLARFDHRTRSFYAL